MYFEICHISSRHCKSLDAVLEQGVNLTAFLTALLYFRSIYKTSITGFFSTKKEAKFRFCTEFCLLKNTLNRSSPRSRTMTNVLTAFSCQRTFVILLFAK